MEAPVYFEQPRISHLFLEMFLPSVFSNFVVSGHVPDVISIANQKSAKSSDAESKKVMNYFSNKNQNLKSEVRYELFW